MACSSMSSRTNYERSSCGGKEAHRPSDFVVGPAEGVVGPAPIDKRARAPDLKNVANPADHDRPPMTVDDFLGFAFERGDSVGSEHNTARRRHPASLEIVQAGINQSLTPEAIGDLSMARGEDADAERRLSRRRRYAGGAIEGDQNGRRFDRQGRKRGCGDAEPISAAREGDDADRARPVPQSFKTSGAARLRRDPMGPGGDDFQRGALSHRKITWTRAFY